MNLTIARTVQVEQHWMLKEDAMKHFGFKEKQARTFSRYLSEFKMNPEFTEGYMNPSYKIVLIDVDIFERFLKWKDKNKFK